MGEQQEIIATFEAPAGEGKIIHTASGDVLREAFAAIQAHPELETRLMQDVVDNLTHIYRSQLTHFMADLVGGGGDIHDLRC